MKITGYKNKQKKLISKKKTIIVGEDYPLLN